MFSLFLCSSSRISCGFGWSGTLLDVGCCWSALLSKTLSDMSLESKPIVAAVALLDCWWLLCRESGGKYAEGFSELSLAVCRAALSSLPCSSFLLSMRRVILSSSLTASACDSCCRLWLSKGLASLSVGVVVEFLPCGREEVLTGIGSWFSLEMSGLPPD